MVLFVFITKSKHLKGVPNTKLSLCREMKNFGKVLRKCLIADIAEFHYSSRLTRVIAQKGNLQEAV